MQVTLNLRLKLLVQHNLAIWVLVSEVYLPTVILLLLVFHHPLTLSL